MSTSGRKRQPWSCLGRSDGCSGPVRSLLRFEHCRRLSPPAKHALGCFSLPLERAHNVTLGHRRPWPISQSHDSPVHRLMAPPTPRSTQSITCTKYGDTSTASKYERKAARFKTATTNLPHGIPCLRSSGVGQRTALGADPGSPPTLERPEVAIDAWTCHVWTLAWGLLA